MAGKKKSNKKSANSVSDNRNQAFGPKSLTKNKHSGPKNIGNKLKVTEDRHRKMSTVARRKDLEITENGTNTKTNTNKSSKSEQPFRKMENEERKSLVLWRRPISTLDYSVRESAIILMTYGKRLLQNKLLLFGLIASALFVSMVVNTRGPHQEVVQMANKKILWCLYWLGLGVLSSVGLGTGLHTFILYLGPHIARVTLAAFECNSVDFPEPPYPDDILCPAEEAATAVSIFSIMAKVRLEAMCWGAGTALGELPPYFMARAARLSGIDPEDEDDELKEFEELQRKAKEKLDLTFIQKGKLFVEDLVKRVGFFGILACASIPNPLFDLAGITCGHFLVPFWTFFGATLIGKAVIKMHIQKLFVIVAFNETLINIALDWLKVVPFVGERLQVPFRAFLDGQKARLHQKDGPGVASDSKNFLATCFEVFVMIMVVYFVVSILNSLAQSYHKRMSKKRSEKASKD